MSSLRKRLREMAESELDSMVAELVHAANNAGTGTIDGSALLRIAAGGKTQVLRESVIKRLCDEMEAKLLTKLNDESDE